MKRFALVPALLMLALPASTAAVGGNDTYVDQGTGSNAGGNDCVNPSTPCKTVVRGIDQAGANHTVFVNGGHTYGANLVLDDGKSLVHKDFAGTGGIAILDGGSDTAHYEVDIEGSAGKVDGFTIRGEGGPLKVAGPARISHNLFDEEAPIGEDARVDATGKVVFDDDTFTDPTPSTLNTDYQRGLSGGPGRLIVKHSRFTGFAEAIGTNASGTAKIAHNEISGTHGLATSAGRAIGAIHATISDNVIHDPGAEASDGIDASGDDVEISNNLIEATSQGVYSPAAGTKVILDNDVIMAGVPVSISGDGSKVKATNVTLLGTTFGATVNVGSQLKLDSSIVGAGPIKAFNGGTCHIKYSRGPSKHSGGNGCRHYDTTKGPKFKSDGFHLKGSSPLIDKGDPHKPPKHTKDIDGDKRALAGDCGHKHAIKRRDIGADEFKCH
jgi:hypothetical protein